MKKNAAGITDAQRRLIVTMGFRKGVLCNGDEGSPTWWIDGGDAVKHNVAQSLYKRGFIALTGHAGGHPGVDYFTVTAAGRAALRSSP